MDHKGLCTSRQKDFALFDIEIPLFVKPRDPFHSEVDLILVLPASLRLFFVSGLVRIEYMRLMFTDVCRWLELARDTPPHCLDEFIQSLPLFPPASSGSGP